MQLSINQDLVDNNKTESSFSERESEEVERKQEIKVETQEDNKEKRKKHIQFKKIPLVKYTFILSSCSLWLGQLFCGNFNGYLKLALLNSLQISEEQFQLFSILSCAPAIPLSFLGGILLDKIGVRMALIIYSTVVTLGGFFVFLGGLQESYIILLIGKILTQVGGEVLTGAINSLFTKWFTGGELAKVSSINLFLGRIASSSSGFIYAPLYKSSGSLKLPLLVAFLSTVYSFIMMIVVVILDRKADSHKLTLSSKKEKPRKLPTFKDIKSLNPIFFLLAFILGINYAIFFPLTQNLLSVFATKFNIDSVVGGQLISIATFCGMTSPIWGMIIQKWGKQTYIFLASSLSGVIALVLFIIFPQCPVTQVCSTQVIFPMILVGFFLTLFGVVIWTSIAAAVPIENIGTAYGIALSLKNLLLTVMPIFIGILLKNKVDGTRNMLFLILFLTIISLALSLAVFFYDRSKGGLITLKKLTPKELKQLRRTTTFDMEI